MIVERNALKYLVKWKSISNRKPLIVRGARQIGKTTLIREFGKDYQHYIELNLEKPKFRKLFENDSLELKDILQRIFLDANVQLGATSTLIFIDEIQESHRAIQLLRYFYEDFPEIHVIATGSLLDHTLGEVAQYPVGRVGYLYLYPINFEEYLRALNKEPLFSVFSQVPYTNEYHDVLLEVFNEYAIIGGLPEVIKNYLQNNKDLTRLPEIYDDLMTGYKNDVEKYAKSVSERRVIRRVMDKAAQHADERVTLEKFGNSQYKSREVGEALDALQKSRILYLLYPQVDTSPPLLSNLRKRPRLQFLDTGMINYKSNIQSELIALSDLNHASRGKTIQHIVVQEWHSIHNRVDYTPVFWTREKKGDAEIDLIIQKGEKLIPIEVKSGKVGKLRSLFTYMDLCDHHYAIRLYADRLFVQNAKTINGKAFKLLNLPYFLGSKLDEHINWFVENY